MFNKITNFLNRMTEKVERASVNRNQCECNSTLEKLPLVWCDPDTLHLPKEGSRQIVEISNALGMDLHFKVGNMPKGYSISPECGLIEAHAGASFEVTRLAGAAKGDKLVIQLGTTPTHAANATAAFNAYDDNPAGTITLPLSATA